LREDDCVGLVICSAMKTHRGAKTDTLLEGYSLER